VAERIVAEGFKPGNGGYTWFAEKAKSLGGPSMAGKTVTITVNVPNATAAEAITYKMFSEFGAKAKAAFAGSPLTGSDLNRAIEARRWELIKQYIGGRNLSSYKIELGHGNGYFVVPKQAALEGATITQISGPGAEAALSTFASVEAEGNGVAAAARFRWGYAAKLLQSGGRALVAVAVAKDVYDIYRAENKAKEGAKKTVDGSALASPLLRRQNSVHRADRGHRSAAASSVELEDISTERQS